MSSVILTGFMGTGKTTIGRLLAERLHVRFIDTDARIEELEGRSVAAVFAEEGEPYFRAVERRVIAEAVQTDAVVATGGGAIVDPVNYRCMHAAGPIVCLTADPDVIFARTATDNGRPLLNNGERRARITELLAERAAAYAQADITVDTSHADVRATVDEILARLRDSTRREGVHR